MIDEEVRNNANRSGPAFPSLNNTSVGDQINAGTTAMHLSKLILFVSIVVEHVFECQSLTSEEEEEAREASELRWQTLRSNKTHSTLLCTLMCEQAQAARNWCQAAVGQTSCRST